MPPLSGTLVSVVEDANGMSVGVRVGWTLPPVVEPIIETIASVEPAWARTALRGAIGREVTIERDAGGSVTRTAVRA